METGEGIHTASGKMVDPYRVTFICACLAVQKTAADIVRLSELFDDPNPDRTSLHSQVTEEVPAELLIAVSFDPQIADAMDDFGVSEEEIAAVEAATLPAVKAISFVVEKHAVLQLRRLSQAVRPLMQGFFP